MNNYTKWIFWIIIYSLNLYLYKQNKIRFSNKKIFSKISYNIFLYYLTIFIIILHTIYANYINNNYPTFNKNLHYLLFIIAILYINITYSKPITDYNSFISPPKYLKKNNKFSYILIILLLIYTVISEIKNIKNYIIYFIPLFIIIVIYSILFHLHNNFATCKYNLPKSMS